jgi:hypothetical protein
MFQSYEKIKRWKSVMQSTMITIPLLVWFSFSFLPLCNLPRLLSSSFLLYVFVGSRNRSPNGSDRLVYQMPDGANCGRMGGPTGADQQEQTNRSRPPDEDDQQGY